MGAVSKRGFLQRFWPFFSKLKTSALFSDCRNDARGCWWFPSSCVPGQKCTKGEVVLHHFPCRRDSTHPWQSGGKRFCAFTSLTWGWSSARDLTASMVWSQQMQFGSRISHINHHRTPSGFQLRVMQEGKKVHQNPRDMSNHEAGKEIYGCDADCENTTGEARVREVKRSAGMQSN